MLKYMTKASQELRGTGMCEIYCVGQSFQLSTGLSSRVHTGCIIYNILYSIEYAYKRKHCVYIYT